MNYKVKVYNIVQFWEYLNFRNGQFWDFLLKKNNYDQKREDFDDEIPHPLPLFLI